jgi:ISXO2-like transposase domain
LASYTGLDKDYVHEFVNHAEEYVRGNVHTNGIENFWSLLKRGLKGTYISVEPFHLFRYLDEQAFRYNERKDNDGGRFMRVMSQVTGRRLTYKNLTGKTGPAIPEPALS